MDTSTSAWRRRGRAVWYVVVAVIVVSSIADLAQSSESGFSAWDWVRVAALVVVAVVVLGWAVPRVTGTPSAVAEQGEPVDLDRVREIRESHGSVAAVRALRHHDRELSLETAIQTVNAL